MKLLDEHYNRVSQFFKISILSFLMMPVHVSTISLNDDGMSVCPLWHVEQVGKCKCVNNFEGLINCSGDTLTVGNYVCLTWDNKTDSVLASYCLIIPMDRKTCKREQYYIISAKLSGPELNKWMCGRLNRQGAHCKQCISGYGPAALSDGVSCADCSMHRHLWILNLLLQLLLLTIMLVCVMVLPIKCTASPWNIIITYSQLVVNALMYDIYLHNRLQCYIGKVANIVIITILGVSNLDFFRLIIPPLCISSSLEAVNTLLFDCIVALYPILMTILVYALIELHACNCRVVVIVSMPLQKLYRYFPGR